MYRDLNFTISEKIDSIWGQPVNVFDSSTFQKDDYNFKAKQTIVKSLVQKDIVYPNCPLEVHKLSQGITYDL